MVAGERVKINISSEGSPLSFRAKTGKSYLVEVRGAQVPGGAAAGERGQQQKGLERARPRPADVLTWIVPCRRAVAQQTVSYPDLICLWVGSLSDHAANLQQWYGLQQDEIEKGLDQIWSWYDLMSQVVDLRIGTSFCVRVWKGPLSVLLEEQGEACLEQDPANNEVFNEDAKFLMGDVVEFPLFKFLVACGKQEYGSISFNPRGSFLCGDALLQDGQPRSFDAEPPIHENFMAMRFQLLLNLLRGAFYSLSPVISSGQLDPHASDGSHEVYARGLLYGAAFGDPTQTLGGSWSRERPDKPSRQRDPREDSSWFIVCNRWGWAAPKRDPKDPATGILIPGNLPTRASLSDLKGVGRTEASAGQPANDPILTPGIVCSPSSLFLVNVMTNIGCQLLDSVRTELTTPPSRLEDYFEEVPSRELVSQDVTPEEMHAAREELRGEVREALGKMKARCVSIANENEGLSRRQRNRISNVPDGVRPLVAALVAVKREIENENVSPEERRILMDLHVRICGEADDLRNLLLALCDDARWRAAQLAPPMLDTILWPFISHSLPPAPQPDCTDAHGVTAEAFKAIEDELDGKRRELRANFVPRELTGVFSAITILAQRGHELSVVRMQPHGRVLLDSPALPLAGDLAAYDPLSGKGVVPETAPATGQYFIFEASGSLSKWRCRVWDEEKSIYRENTMQACELKPFRFFPIENNTISFALTGSQLQYLKPFPGTAGSATSLPNVYRINDERLRATYVGGAATQPRQPPRSTFEPMGVVGLQNSRTATASGPLADPGTLFADRAVPFPTYLEAARLGNFPIVSEVMRALDVAATWVDRMPDRTEAMNDYLAAVGPPPPQT